MHGRFLGKEDFTYSGRTFAFKILHRVETLRESSGNMVDPEKEVAATATSPPLMSTASSDRDDNYETYRLNRGLEYTAEEEKSTLRKIDMRLIPLLFLIYLLQVCCAGFGLCTWDCC